jgi:methylmalonyl-CoA/ethylmalonyl-CoA epimerase
VSRFIEKKGEGLHHICFSVEDLKSSLQRLEKEGFEIIGSGDERGVEGLPVAFVHPRSSRGVLIEFIESEKKAEE